jgi:prepilin signal peptidase PulO-like enzyme (type II secretory pathway)
MYLDIFFILTLLAIIYFDIKSFWIPDLILIPSFIFLSIMTAFEIPLPYLLLRFAIGTGLFLLVYLLNKKRIGFGDVKLSMYIAVYLGLFQWYLSILLGSVGALIFLFMKRRKDPDAFSKPLAFGAFIAAASIMVLLVNNLFGR